jgi:hypothetical protein
MTNDLEAVARHLDMLVEKHGEHLV